MGFRIVSFALLFSFAIAGSARTQALLLPGYSTGSGNNTAAMVLDFAFIGGDAYLFEYRFDGQATAEDMLLALDAAGSLDLDVQYFEFDDGQGQLVRSIFINGFTYDGNSSIPAFEGSQGESWSFWLVDDRVAAPGFWSPAATGPTDRILEDGAFDGWSLNISPFNSLELEATFDTPPVPPTPGDLDADGDVDGIDLSTIFTNFTGPNGDGLTSIQGDLDRDGDIDGVDLSRAFTAFTGPAISSPVPEPASAVLLVGSLLFALRRI